MSKTMRIIAIFSLFVLLVTSLVACGSSTSTISKTNVVTTTVPAAVPTNTVSATVSSAAPTSVTSSISQAPSTTTPAVSTNAPAVSANPPSTTSSQTAGTTLGEMLGRVAGIASMKYDMVTTLNNTATISIVYVKKLKMRMETSYQGQNSVILINADSKTMYMYTPAQNSAIKMDFSQAPKSAGDNANSILQYTPTVTGTETLDGKVCQIIEYSDKGVATKTWIWIEKGLPVRVQATTAQGISTVDFKNYDFSDVQDSIFELPAGVAISSFSLPSGIPTALPSGFPSTLPSGFPSNLPSIPATK